MSLTAGIVGLPNVGKSTLFNAITKNNILIANYPFATIEPNVGTVMVPDNRLDVLNKMYDPKKLIKTTFEFTDIAGLVKGASKGEGLGNKFLSHIREVDAICEVVRCFNDPNVIHVEGNADPIRDIEIINIELTLADLEVIQNRISKIEKKAQTTKDKEALKELTLLNTINDALTNDIPVRRLKFTPEEEKMIKSFNLLTSKPIIYIANIKESDIGLENEYTKLVRDYALKDNADVIEMCAKIESEISSLDDEERTLFLNELGIKESGLDSLIKSTYSLLGLRTFFTVGTDEVRAWTFKKGMKAPECAGIIHTDFQKGFIKAEVMSYDDLIECGSETKVKESGKMRLEGKEYEMQDGDICHFRFNK
ncbi:MAG: redox-regulated ATPase YchF [Tenericutes bacterium]|nr:redox-regulated ATPase YchF [Mycoplasmatota bacterium]MDD7629979.1 redox-regulated ATPase YchF [bacterium]MDY4108764.1 redox-regulated ATPase YchF [Bacilli bacterium]